jgi:hypothetical protein
MFRKFHFAEVKELELIYELLKKCYTIYQNNENNLPDIIQQLLTAAEKYFSLRGLKSEEGKVMSLKAELSTAERGIHPYSLTIIITGKRKMNEMVQYKVLQEIEEIVRTKLQELKFQLQNAYRLCQQIITKALDSQYLTESEMIAAIQIHKTENLWQILIQQNELRPSCRQLMNQVSEPDILLLLNESTQYLIQPNPQNI